MPPQSHHEQLLERLREASVGPPTIPPLDETMENRYVGWRCQLDMMTPIFGGTFRCSMVRSVVAFLTGASLLGIAFLSYLLRGGGMLAALAGCCLIAAGIRGVPGGVPFMEVKTQAGFYGSDKGKHTKRNGHVREVFQSWLGGFNPSPIAPGGEFSTVLPYIWNSNRGKDLKYERLWVQAKDGERHACDWVFPPGGYDPSRPIVLLLPGMAPDTHWREAGGFLNDAAWHLSTKAGITAVVCVARGTMDTKVAEFPFHGARVTDLGEVIAAAKKVTKGIGKDDSSPPIFAAGFSMGAIMIGNYCGKVGKDSGLAGAVHFSGTYDGAFNHNFEYSLKTWQTYLAFGGKQMALTMFGSPIHKRALKVGVDLDKVFSGQTASLLDLDEEFATKMFGYKGPKDQMDDVCLAAKDKWKNVEVPMLAIVARDDPITHCDGMKAEKFSKGNPNLLFLVMETGGHVGFPWGVKPWERGFDFMSEAIALFTESILSSP